jgi:uncharacterized protein
LGRITFLDNASEGKNSWWRYLLTIVLTWGGGKALGLIISPVIISIFFYFVISGIFTPDQANETLSNPLFELFLLGIIYVFLFLIFYILLRFLHEKRIMSLINTASKIDWKRIVKGAGIWFAIMAVEILILLIISPGSFEVTFNPNNFFLLLILSILVFSIQAPFEELFFRGYLMQGIGLLTKKPVIPLILTSILFAVLHFGNGENGEIGIILMIHAFIFGITMGIIVLGENRLETAMGVHIADNVFVSSIVNNPDAGFGNLPSVLTTHGIPNLIGDTLIYVLISIVLLVIVFWNKKDKLYNIIK